MPIETIVRRRVLAAASWLVAPRSLATLAATIAAAWPPGARAQSTGNRLVPTPTQTEGPYYPRTLPADRDADLVAIAGAAATAKGTVLHLTGSVRADDGAALAGALVEIWQCDANGRYHHVDDGGGERPRDPGFQGYGQAKTGDDGSYRFRTIRPVPYPGRSPHIHLRVSHPAAQRLTTQMYVTGDSSAGDMVFSSSATRERLTVALHPAPGREVGALEGRFDLVLARR